MIERYMESDKPLRMGYYFREILKQNNLGMYELRRDYGISQAESIKTLADLQEPSDKFLAAMSYLAF